MSVSNVVKLPTAANRQQREAIQDAERIAGMGASAELVLATAIFQTMDEIAKLRVFGFVARACNTEEGRQAMSWLERIDGTATRRREINEAMQRLDEVGL